MNASIYFKSGVGLIYTTILFFVIYLGLVWLSQYLIGFTWKGAILFWAIGLPVIIGLFQAIASLAAIPTMYLLKRFKWLCWLLLLPMLYFAYRFGAFLWELASAIGGILTWLLLISWFCETVWLFVAYFIAAIGSAYETDEVMA